MTDHDALKITMTDRDTPEQGEGDEVTIGLAVGTVDDEFAQINVDVDPGTVETLCRLYVANMHLATQSLYAALIKQGATTEHAVYRAVVNETILHALIEQANRYEAIPASE